MCVCVCVCVCVVQKEEDKKSSGPKPTRNHQQRLENIVKQTTVETKVTHSNTHSPVSVTQDDITLTLH